MEPHDTSANGKTGDDARVPERAPGVMLRRIAGQAMLIPVTGELVDLQRIYALNETGSLVWERADGSRTVADIARGVADATEGAERAAVARDVRDFVTRLAAEGLVTERA